MAYFSHLNFSADARESGRDNVRSRCAFDKYLELSGLKFSTALGDVVLAPRNCSLHNFSSMRQLRLAHRSLHVQVNLDTCFAFRQSN